LNYAEFFARELAMRGIVVVSGLARGIDTAAHKGALSTGSTTAIFGTGIDRVYPSENRKLAESIVQKGALLSEFPLGTPPLPGHFPRRNRILAGMTRGTVVVEATERSGSLITARLALEADREVLAVPGPMHSKRAAVLIF
jgi:DNA processing protein